MQLSIIIPTLNEAHNIADLVAYLRVYGGAHVREIIVADGGSHDGTATVAANAGATVLPSPQPSRAHQLNLGAAHSQGEILYFVHADVVPPVTFATDVLTAVAEGFLLGNYASRFVGQAQMGVNGRFTQRDLLITRGGGDQTLFVTREFFVAQGGMDERYVLMEDFDFVRRARKQTKMKIFSAEVLVSTRKYLRNSYLRVSLVNLVVYTSFRLHVPPRALAWMYRKLLRPIPKSPDMPSMLVQAGIELTRQT
jgi:rSAM/selenodomain-associated transferase 2